MHVYLSVINTNKYQTIRNLFLGDSFPYEKMPNMSADVTLILRLWNAHYLVLDACGNWV